MVPFVVWRLVWNSDMPGVLVTDTMGFSKTFISIVVVMIWKLLTKKVVMELCYQFFGGIPIQKWVNMADNTNLRMICKEQDIVSIAVSEWCTLLPWRDPDDYTSRESSTYISIQTTLYYSKAVRGRDMQEHYWRYALCDRYWIGQSVGCRIYESEQKGSQYDNQ